MLAIGTSVKFKRIVTGKSHHGVTVNFVYPNDLGTIKAHESDGTYRVKFIYWDVWFRASREDFNVVDERAL